MPESTPAWILKRYLEPLFCLETYQSFFFVLFRQPVSLENISISILQLLDSSLTWRRVAQKRVLLEHYVYFTRLEVRHLTDEVRMREHTQREEIERDRESEVRGGGGKHKEEEPRQQIEVKGCMCTTRWDCDDIKGSCTTVRVRSCGICTSRTLRLIH